MIFFKRQKFTTGAHLDSRTTDEKSLDYLQTELVATVAPVIWTKKTNYRSFPIRKQNGSGSCVMQSLEKERGIIAMQKYGEFLEFSANFGYQLRENTNFSGSTVNDLTKATQAGAILEKLSPSMSLNDLKMMKANRPAYFEDFAKPFGANRIFIAPWDIDTIASTIENTGKGIGLTVRFGKGEWFGNKEVKELLPEKDWTLGHRVVAVDYTLNDKGEKCLVIEDSACEDGFPQRLVPESFLMKRTYWSPNYILNFKQYIEKPDRPSYSGTVVNLQNILKYEGFFPTNTDSTGYFGSITKKALIKFQTKYGLTPADGTLSENTQAKLKELYP